MAAKDFLRNKGYETVVSSDDSEKYLASIIHDFDAVLTRTATISEQVIKKAAQLKIIAKHGVGMDCIDLESAAQHNILVTNTPLANTGTVAEHIVMMMIALAKNTLKADREMRRGNYDARHKLDNIDLEGKTLGVIGIGRIGSNLAKKAALGFGMKVIGHDPYLSQAPDYISELCNRDDVFKKSDFVSVHCPLTKETIDSISLSEFELMKTTSFFINASRGEVVREDDLLTALETDLIKGAAIDVFRKEPPDRDNPLFKMENILLTPHNASLTHEGRNRMAMHAVMEIDRCLSGQKPEWPVNLQ